MMDRDVLFYNGALFENEIARYLKQHFSDIEVLVNLRLFSSYLRKDTQIDVVAICSFGVFVIEAKNWKQWIKGEYNDRYWAGKSKSKDAMRVFNVVAQNFIHVRALRNRLRALGFEPVKFNSIVCVPDGTEIISRCTEVCNLSSLALKMNRQSKINTVSIDIAEYKKVISMV